MKDEEIKNTNGRKRKKKNRRKKKVLKTILIILLFLVIGGATFAISYLSNFKKIAEKNNKDVKTKVVKKNEPVNMLLVGVDIGDPKSKSANDPKRTDTMMLINYNPKTEDINVVSIPRDTMIKINGKTEKINDANVRGGINCAIDTVEKLLEVPINFYGKINYEGFDKIIDTIGGIDMPITTRMDYDDSDQNLHIHFKKGTVAHLEGKKAEEYFRWRKNNDNTGLAEGDIGRIKNQHIFIGKVIDKFKSPGIIPKIPSILSIIPKYMETNMGAKDIMKYGTIFASTDKNKIKMSTLAGEGKYIGITSYFIYDEEKSKDILQAIKGGGVSKDKDISDKNQSSFNRENVKLKILNGTNKSGMAGSLSETEKEKGYKDITTGNSTKVKKSKITIYGSAKEYVDEIKKDFNIENVEFSTGNGQNDIVVLLGEDYKGQ